MQYWPLPNIPAKSVAPETQVLIVDDHGFIHESLSAVVGKAMPGAAVHAVSTLEEAIIWARRSAGLAFVLMDLGLPGCTGIDALARFRGALPKSRVLVVTATEDAKTVRAAFAAGAVGYIPKNMPPALMVATIRLIAEGGTYFPPELLATPIEKAHGLTDRQAAVLKLVVKGLGNQEIAKRLKISENTVKQHTHAIYSVLKVTSRTQALVAAARLGITSE